VTKANGRPGKRNSYLTTIFLRKKKTTSETPVEADLATRLSHLLRFLKEKLKTPLNTWEENPNMNIA